ncbi:hypothetical protein PFNF135_01837 [Plasmodium falciparum NF135/5.C10]|nr:hypothetical protein PFNF135_01837 [Plasmodium falciparum NF135/5.C10]
MDTYDDTSYKQSVTPSDTSTNNLTDQEWNQLKQDFILKMLQSTQMNLHNEITNDDNIHKDIEPNTLYFDNHDEKPFITKIKDKYLDSSGEEVTYNINWNVPINTNITTNTTDDPKYVSLNNIYSGMNLINDTLNFDNHVVDIYGELLKRKENELFGTKHISKHTPSNIFAKQIYGDHILNQIDLFHKWLDRNRDMLTQWNKKEMFTNLINKWKSYEKKIYSPYHG